MCVQPAAHTDVCTDKMLLDTSDQRNSFWPCLFPSTTTTADIFEINLRKMIMSTLKVICWIYWEIQSPCIINEMCLCFYVQTVRTFLLSQTYPCNLVMFHYSFQRSSGSTPSRRSEFINLLKDASLADPSGCLCIRLHTAPCPRCCPVWVYQQETLYLIQS